MATQPSSLQPKGSWSRTPTLIFSSVPLQSTRLPVLAKHCGLLQSHLPTNRQLSNPNYACIKPTAPITNPLCLLWQHSSMLLPGSRPNLPSAKLLTAASLHLSQNSLVTSSENTFLFQCLPLWGACAEPQKVFAVLSCLPLLSFQNSFSTAPIPNFP